MCLDGFDIIGDTFNTTDGTMTGIETHTVSFGASLPELQDAATLAEMQKNYDGTPFGDILGQMSAVLSGSNTPGMEIIKSCVDDTAAFYGIDSVKVFYEAGEPGVQFSGYTDAAYDNWIGGDPAILEQYASQYGDAFIQNVFAHEMGHHIFDQLGFEDNMPRISNEACADYLAGLYAGSRNISPDGFASFLAEQPQDGVLYPDGDERSALFWEGYNTAQNYTWNGFQTILQDHSFNLRDKLTEISQRYM